MEAYYFTVNRDDGIILHLSPLTDRKIHMSGENIADTSGYFLYEKKNERNGNIRILAQVFSEEAVLALKNMFEMS